jgi:hypothetical protein
MTLNWPFGKWFFNGIISALSNIGDEALKPSQTATTIHPLPQESQHMKMPQTIVSLTLFGWLDESLVSSDSFAAYRTRF